MPAPYGVTDAGFNRKRLPEILSDIESGTKEVFGQDLDVTPQSPNGQFNGLIASALSTLWELAENVYHSIDFTQASGERLDALLELLGLPPRRGAIYSGTQIDFLGSAGVTIPSGTSISSSSSATVLYTELAVIIDSSGEASVTASPIAEGAISVVANEMDLLTTPITGVTTVDNPNADVVGILVTPAETDAQIRQRLLGSSGGVSVTNSQLRMESILRGLEGVIESVLYVNSTSSVDARGIPAKSYALVIEGGDDIAIGNTLWLNHSAGIGTFGSTSASITDAQGICHKMNFSRPRDAIALLQITVRYVDGRCGCQPQDVNGLKTLLIQLLNDNRQDCGGFGIGQPLIRSRLYAAFSQVPGLEIVELKMAKHHYQFSMDCTEPAWDAKGFCEGEWVDEIVYTDASIPMAWDEKALFVEQGISLTVIDKFDNTIASNCINGVKTNG